MIDRSAERTLKRREMFTPSVMAKLEKYREAATNKAIAERTLRRRAATYKAQRPKWHRKLCLLRLALLEIKNGKTR